MSEKLCGKVTIISAFPGIGKSTANKLLEYHPMVEIHDIDSGEFKESLKARGLKFTPEESDSAYVQRIRCVYENLTERLIMDPERDHRAYIIFVSAHDRVREYMTNNGLKFRYLFPSLESLPRVIEGANARREEYITISALKREYAEKDPNVAAMTRAMAFLKSQGAAASIQRSMNGEDVYAGQVETVMLDFNLEGSSKTTITDYILNCISEECEDMEKYMAAHRYNDRGKNIIEIMLRDMRKILRDTKCRHQRINPDGTPVEANFKNGYRTQLGFDQFGRIVQIYEAEDFYKDIYRRMFRFMDASEVNTIGNFGLDSIVLKKDDAAVILEHLLDSPWNTDELRQAAVSLMEAVKGKVIPIEELITTRVEREAKLNKEDE